MGPMDGKQVDLVFGHSILPTDKGGARDFFDVLVTLGLLLRRRCSRDAQPEAIGPPLPKAGTIYYRSLVVVFLSIEDKRLARRPFFGGMFCFGGSIKYPGMVYWYYGSYHS